MRQHSILTFAVKTSPHSFVHHPSPPTKISPGRCRTIDAVQDVVTILSNKRSDIQSKYGSYNSMKTICYSSHDMFCVVSQCQILTYIICFFLSSKFSSKKYSHQIIFAQTKLNENNFTSHMWWVLIEEIALVMQFMYYNKSVINIS